jgi:alkylation response protein AidB-like acyl-CoA dehydrogenase
MNFAFTPEQEQFRKEVRDFLEKELPPGTDIIPEDGWVNGFSPEFSRKVAQQGWIGLTWPKEYGGQERSYLDRLILTEEILRYGAPVSAHWFGDRQMGPSILAHGTEELKQEFLPRIIRGEITFGIGQSEPEAGSDLVSIKTRADEKDDHYLVNGQKLWTSGAHQADYLYMIARTDPEATKKHKGISEFLVDLKSDGITVNPLTDLSGGIHQTEVFLDNVKVPKKYLVGEKNRGWYQIMSQLDYERSGIERLMSNYPIFRDIKTWSKAADLSQRVKAQIRTQIAELEIQFEVGRLLCYRIAWMLSNGIVPNYETAMTKFYCTEFEQRLANTATQILGLYGQLLPRSKFALLSGRATRNFLYSPAYTIQGGTSQIMRTIVATRGLGLPTG